MNDDSNNNYYRLKLDFLAMRIMARTGQMNERKLWRSLVVSAAIACLASISPLLHIDARSEDRNPFLPQISDGALYERAIEKERPIYVVPEGVTGISVPHHLLAADLMARGFWAASAGKYRRIVILSPDHFRAVRGKFATASNPTDTAFGTVPGDPRMAGALLARTSLFEPARNLAHEHGIQALMPFVARFFPDTPVIPVVASISTGPADWDEAVDALSGIIDDQTLVIQSTDYSHYLPWSSAVRKDRETLAVIAANDFAKVAMLNQPDNMDSKAAQYIQMKLQATLFGASSAVIANGNSTQYGGMSNNTTSYIVTAYHRQAKALGALQYAGQPTYYFAGDTLIGRYMADSLEDKDAARALSSSVLEITGGKPLIVNLEGSLAPDIVMGVSHTSHMMNAELAASILAAMNVKGASLANNHSLDFGISGFNETVATLRKLGIAPLQHGAVADFEGFSLLPMMLLPMAGYPNHSTTDLSDLDKVCTLGAAPPLVVFAHWGQEYTLEETARDRSIKQRLAACGVSLMIGGHSHVASNHIEIIAGESLAVHSLGNFLFDQNSSRSSGAMLELRLFDQGTIGARLIPLPNFFEMGKALIEAR